MDINIQTKLEASQHIAAEWAVLADTTPSVECFRTATWFQAWLSAFGKHANSYITTVRRHGVLIGVLPLVEHLNLRRPWYSMHHVHRDDLEFLRASSRRGCLVPVRQLSFAANLEASSIRGGVLVHPGDEEQVNSALARHVASRSDWDLMLLSAVVDDQAANLAAGLRDAGLHVHVEPSVLTLYGVQPLPWEEYTKNRSGRFRRRMRNWESKLSRAGTVSFHVETGPANLHAALAELHGLGLRSWKQQPRDGQSWHLPLTQRTRLFDQALISHSDANTSVLIVQLRLDGRLVCGLLALQTGKRLTSLRQFYDPQLDQDSPGQVMWRELIDWSAEQGLAWIDTNGNSEFAQRFATVPARYSQVWAFRKRGYSALLACLFERSNGLTTRFKTHEPVIPLEPEVEA